MTQPSVGIGLTLTKLSAVSLYKSEEGSQVAQTKVPFNTQLIVFGFSVDQKRLFVRTVPAGASEVPMCGWVSIEKVLIPRNKRFKNRFKRPQPLQMRDISKTQDVLRNQLNVKAVVHDLAITGESEGGIDVFEDPTSGHASDKIKLFDAYLVYDKMELPPDGARGETLYWLIGDQSGKNDATSLRGWIRQRDVVIWPSRLAVQWNQKATVKGYASPENLMRKENEITLPSRIVQFDYYDQISRRLPVLEQSPPPETIIDVLPAGVSLEARKETALNLIKYYRIATPGRACRKDNPADCLEAREIDRQREKVANAEKAVTKIDILILIDATESMDPYFASTVRTIEDFVKKTEIEDVRKRYDLRFGISLYGDYTGESANIRDVEYREIVPYFRPAPPLGTSGAMKMLLMDPKTLVVADRHRDKLEAPFAAVIRATQTARWRPIAEVPLRFLVHITDSGNRGIRQTAAETQMSRYKDATERANPPQSTIRERYREEDVVEALRQHNVIYVPVGIQDGSESKPHPAVWGRIFKEQSDKILKLLGVDAPIKETFIPFTSQSPESIQNKIIASVGDVMTKVENGLDYQRCKPNSASEKCIRLKKEEKTITTPEIVKLVNRVASVSAGLSSEEIKNIYSRDQSIVTMYVPARSDEGVEMFTHWVALDEKEFKLLRDLLRTLCSSMGEQDSRNPVMRGLREFAEMYSNEDFTDLTVSEILGKRLGIPNLEQTDFSGRTRDEIDDAYRAWQSGGDRRTWETWHQRACKADTFVRLMEDEKKVDPKKITCNLDHNTCDVPDKLQSKFRWKIEVERDSPTYFVPLDVLP